MCDVCNENSVSDLRTSIHVRWCIHLERSIFFRFTLRTCHFILKLITLQTQHKYRRVKLGAPIGCLQVTRFLSLVLFFVWQVCLRGSHLRLPRMHLSYEDMRSNNCCFLSTGSDLDPSLMREWLFIIISFVTKSDDCTHGKQLEYPELEGNYAWVLLAERHLPRVRPWESNPSS